MSEHPDEDVLVELALGRADQRLAEDVTGHLTRCAGCRRSYDDLAGAVELVLPAVPRVAPPPSFETSVLGRLAEVRGTAGAFGRRTFLWAAVAGVLGVTLGGGLTAYLDREDPPAAARPDWVAPLLTAEGQEVGVVTRSYGEEGPVLVVDVLDGPVGTRYTCRVRLADGSTQDVGSWTLTANRPNSWVVEVASLEVEAVEMVAETGEIWSTADL